MIDIEKMQEKIIKEIGNENIIEEIGKGIFHRDFDYSEIESDKISFSKGSFEEDGWKNTTVLEVLDYKIEVIDGFGGMGKGDDYWGVAKISRGDENVLIRVSGWYQSYYGAECDEPEEWEVVTPKKTIKIEYV